MKPTNKQLEELNKKLIEDNKILRITNNKLMNRLSLIKAQSDLNFT